MTPRLTSNFYTRFRGVLERVTLLSTSWMGGRGRSLQAGRQLLRDVTGRMIAGGGCV